MDPSLRFRLCSDCEKPQCGFFYDSESPVMTSYDVLNRLLLLCSCRFSMHLYFVFALCVMVTKRLY